jgi:tRNA-Thr(GGU) m(6)t(6)A37 methyltransferase TsaA
VKIEYRPIGVVRSPFTRREDTPSQPYRSDGACGTVSVDPEYARGLRDLEGFSHIILICHLHRSAGYELEIVPRRETELRGLFATRSPRRPNPIGLSVVRLISVEGTTLTVEDLDLLDGTPVLDIKPFVGELGDSNSVRRGWIDEVREPTRSAEPDHDPPTPPGSTMKTVTTATAPDPAGHYSQAVIHNGLIFVSGQLAIDAETGTPMSGSIEQQTRLAIRNLEAVLVAAGSGLDRVVKTTVYVSDINLWGRVNTVYSKCFGDHRPARAVVPTRDLHFGCLVEIEAVAAVGP